jgi:outer membrane lipopolysaccharide assembly protein LptE/RlpB
VATEANVFVIEMIDRTAADSTAWLAQKVEQRTTAIELLRQGRLQEWIEALRASAEVVDRRAEVLQPADSTSLQFPAPF